MQAIQLGAIGIAFALDAERRLLGTLTDGDVRRALLQGKSIAEPLAPYMRRAFTSVSPQASRAEVLDLMRARVIQQVPIVNETGRIEGVHLLREILGASERTNWAVIMAGGQGVRLRPVTEHIPKPMLRVAGRPILERIVLHLVGFGFRNLFLSVNYLGHVIEEHFGDGERFGCKIQYLREDKPLGTGGSLSLLPSAPSQSVVVMNGDLVTQARLDLLLEHREACGATATIGAQRYYHRVPYGCLSLAPDGRVLELEEKPTFERWVSAGMYVLSPPAVAMVPRDFFSITTLFEMLLKQGQTVAAFEVDDDWIDVGQKEQLASAQGKILTT